MSLPLQLQAPRTITLELPTPPSSNRYWRTLLLPGRGKKSPTNPTGLAAIVVKSTEARVYDQNVKVLVHQQLGHDLKPLDGELEVHITWRRERRQGDVSNRIKVVEDALKGLVYVDDKQVRRISAERIDGETPGITVRVVELP